ncbi:MAG: 4'-phosphopantetheinyl transferase superfamily protein [Bacteroidales bacterium]|nr:4'-phosphopantetheinyl transferase superfamily protein [Bacteroidales bacterium]
MGLFRLIEDENSQIALWKVTESEQELKDLTGLDLENTYAYPRRRIERMVVRAILNQLNHFESVNYYPNGRPYYSGGKPHISISHASKMVAVGFCQNLSIGVDVEQTNRDFKTVAHKYITNKELKWINLEHQKSLALAWCIKESIYKLPWKVTKCFSTDINILEFGELLNRGVVKVEVVDMGIIHHLELNYLFFDEFCLSWVLNDFQTTAC